MSINPGVSNYIMITGDGLGGNPRRLYEIMKRKSIEYNHLVISFKYFHGNVEQVKRNAEYLAHQLGVTVEFER